MGEGAAMDEGKSEFLLKVLSGNHQGAEIVFGYETIVIGSDSSSDVILSDSLIKPRHVELTFSGDGITAKPLDSKVFVDGKLIKNETANVEQLQFITIGSTHMVIGPADQTWPAISAADAPQIGGEVEISEEDAKVLEINDEIPLDAGNVKKIKKRKTLIYGCGALVIATFAVALLSFMSMFSEPEKVIEKPDTFKLLQKVVSDMKLSNSVTVTKEATGFVASGYTTTEDEISVLRTKLNAIDPTTKRKLYSEEKILSEINAQLALIESHPQVKVVTNGVFMLTGYVYDKTKWSKTRKRISEDVTGIVDLQDEVILPEKATNVASPIIARYKLTKKVRLMPQPEILAVVGLISKDEEESWKLAKVQLEKAFRDIPLKNLVRIDDQEVIRQQYFGSEVSSVSISENGMNWIGFKDGARYMVGSTLSNGYSIKDITPDNIVLTKDNQTIILKIGELK
ncbi:MAG: type III secretion system inner membrane ring subunit SctD [Puniceicoccales bacterium]|jgi:type III secretion system YscD/HrpQ family protein|nr:type III secretion system inner membrane ring subunit SctD [Puniceicoccales bacterium]